MNQTDQIKHFLKIVLLFVVLGVVFWLLFNLLGISFISLLSSEDYFPSDGTWYCEELQLQVSFDDPKDCYITVEGDTIFCEYSIDKGSNWLSVICKDNGSEHFD